jgi:hypothetical protein
LKFGFQSCGADEKPSARIADYARMKKLSVHNRRSHMKTKPSVPLSITGFSVRMLFIRAENPVGARSAQGRGND